MNEEQYFALINDVEDKLSCMDIKMAEELVDKLFEIKPVRLKWYLLKAKLMLKQGKAVEEILAFFEEKCQPWYLYEGVEEYFVFLSVLAEYKGDKRESRRNLCQLDKLRESQGEMTNGVQVKDAVRHAIECAEQEGMTAESIQKIADLFYIDGNIYIYILFQLWKSKIYTDTAVDIPSWILKLNNVGYFIERLLSNKEELFVIMATSVSDERECMLIARALREMGNKVIVFGAPVEWKETSDIGMAAMASIKTIVTENANERATVYVIDEIGDTREALLEYIVRNFSEDGLATVLGSGRLLDSMAMQDSIKPRLERLTEAEGDYQEDNIAVGRYGDYLAYIANIYKTSKVKIQEELYRKPDCRFSIIIPCRNADETLYYTLKTCLNQSYTGDYEIVVSDNSESNGVEETLIYQICQRFQDERIKYYRTPGNYSLMKNFEYAYLKSRGEFLLSMGADDGILPWALEELDKVLQREPEEPIFLWDEASYDWPSSPRCGGNSVLRSDNPYTAENIEIIHYLTQSVFEESFQQYGRMYFLPQIHHNCGIRREYMGILYEKTGVLWGGFNQDISMAVTVGNIEKKLCFMKEVLTITGISSASTGVKCIMGTRKLEQDWLLESMNNTRSQGWRAQGYMERICPPMGGCYSGLYACSLYAYAIGAVSDESVEKFDWKAMYKRMYRELSKMDILFDRHIHRLRYIMSLHGEEMLEWFDREVYSEAMEPVRAVGINDKETEEKSSYQEIIEIGGKRVEAMPYSIDDVYKVSLYLQKIRERDKKEKIS